MSWRPSTAASNCGSSRCGTTAVLRLSKLRVRDEINEALRYYHSSLFDVVPELEATIEQLVATRWGIDVDASGAVRMGSWIGGDRDGNPNVTADVLRSAVARQSLTSFTHHLHRINALARELPISMRLVTPTPELLALAEESCDTSPFRADEPYRRALRGMYARLFGLGEVVLEPFGTSIGAAIPPPEIRRPPYERFDDLADDLAVIAASLRSHGAGTLADDIVEPVRRSAVTFGAHLCGLDLRQNAAVHEVVVAELLAVAGVEADYLGLSEADRVTLLAAELASPRPLYTSTARYGERVVSELAVLDAAAEAVAHLGPAVVPHYVISAASSVSDVLEVAVLLRDVGLLRPTRPGADHHRHRPAVRDDRRPHGERRHAALPARRARLPAAPRRPRLPPRGDDRLLGLEQGRRVPHVELGTVGGAGTTGCRGPRVGRAAAAVPWSWWHRRPRRRAGVRGDPRPAGRFGRRPDPDHRAGRDGRGEVRPAGIGAAQPRDARGRHPRGVGGRRRRPRCRSRSVREA